MLESIKESFTESIQIQIAFAAVMVALYLMLSNLSPVCSTDLKH